MLLTAGVQTKMVKADDGSDLCVEIVGEDAAATVLVCAGTPNSRHLYRGWVDDALARGLRLVGYDRPGYGRSSPRPGRIVADGAADVRAIAAALGVERLAVWGFSGGGPDALGCAALLPDLVCAVATVGSSAPWDAAGLDYLAGMGEANVEGIKHYFEDPEDDRRRTREARDEMLRFTPADLIEGWKTLLSPVDLEVLSGELAESLMEAVHDGLGPGEQGWWDDSVAHLSPWGFELDSIRVPVKVWHGREDRFVPIQHGQWLAQHIPGAEATLSGTDGHLTLIFDKVGDVHEWLHRYL